MIRRLAEKHFSLQKTDQNMLLKQMKSGKLDVKVFSNGKVRIHCGQQQKAVVRFVY